MPTQYQITPGTLAPNCYPADPQTLINEAMEKSFVTIDLTGIVRQQATPAATDRDKLWIKVDASDKPVGQFVFAAGAWIWEHPVPPNSDFRWLWVGSEVALQTIDGGAAVAVSDTTGPFWEVDHDFDGRSPMGPGTIPGKTIAPLSIAVGGELGEAEHTQVEAEVGEHTHESQFDLQNADSGSGVNALNTADPTSNEFQVETQVNQAQANVTPMNVIHPVRGIFLVKRTTRIYRTG